ncbi:DUF2695 domain-containing protein [Blastococcus sp. TF02A-26]|uniref:DUF2695 domain-containing protein n=1 Tax=Blastococcus sp. TF02A-26 TaxID=2250577 RepID=UPI000DEAC8D9|nr:DUF2695 domain-containing protein [Blastococcus sp. TF02A-26]RBY84169.1 DUF2695 domain-containing protein [Blastococcus sp. TF02A-26]
MTTEDEKARRKQLKDDYLRAEQAANAALMPIDRDQLESLLDHVDAALEEAGGCDDSPRFTDEWAEQHGVDVDRLHEGLLEWGGGCDCEVVANVEPELVFDPVRQPRERPDR